MSSSDAPVRPSGLRTRSGNAMQRTRAAILDAAADCVEQVGVRRTTMGELARTGGVAKATLYNHFRTKDDVLAALVLARAEGLLRECRALAGEPLHVPGLPAGAPTGLAGALEHAATALAGSRPLRRVAQDEPALLAPLAVPGPGRAWDEVRAGVDAVLVAGGAPGGPVQVEAVLRWLLSALLWPPSGEDAAAGAALLAGALGGAPAGAAPADPAPGASSPPSPGRAQDERAGAGLGRPPET